MLSTIKFLIIAIICLSAFFLLGKYKALRAILCIIFLIALFISGVMSYAHLNMYYQASGGVYGEITDLIKTNVMQEETTTNDVCFDFHNVVLTKDGDYYSLEFIKDDTLILEADEDYLIYVNGFPCDIITESITEDNSFIIARYNYIFYDRTIDGELIVKADDKMQIEFDFYKTSTKLKVFVFDGDNTNSLWNAYFNKNNFNIRVQKVSKLYNSGASYSELKLVCDDEIFMTLNIKNETEFMLPNLEDKDNLIFVGWADVDGNLVENNIVNITSNDTYYAVYEEEIIEEEVVGGEE